MCCCSFSPIICMRKPLWKGLVSLHFPGLCFRWSFALVVFVDLFSSIKWQLLSQIHIGPGNRRLLNDRRDNFPAHVIRFPWYRLHTKVETWNWESKKVNRMITETVILNSSKEKKQVFSPDLSVRPIYSDMWSYVLAEMGCGNCLSQHLFYF